MLPGDLERSLDGHFDQAADHGPARPRRAVMLPHAGWMFCGDVAARVLVRTSVPDRVVVIGPKHTPYGPPWSVACHERWDMPGGAVPIATDLVEQLCGRTPGLKREADAHRVEHAVEVLLPFLRRCNPEVQVVPIVIGGLDYEGTAPLAEALGSLAAAHGPDLLLVISSDMNHFASEAENRRRDMVALEAMGSGDPRRLFQTCVQHDISMCGLVPATIVMRALLGAGDCDLQPELVDYDNSASVTGDRRQVVGYAGVTMD
jgi:hypothetical protein